MKLIPIVTTIFAASAPFLGGVPAHAQAPPRVVHVQAWIDGRSQLILTGATAQWQHFDFAAPRQTQLRHRLPERADQPGFHCVESGLAGRAVLREPLLRRLLL